VERWMERRNQAHHYKITSRYTPHLLPYNKKIFVERQLKHKRLKLTKAGETLTGIWVLQGTKEAHKQFTEHMQQDASTTKFEF
jgi:putative Mg2+ transporter-C (MgtC) family protein